MTLDMIDRNWDCINKDVLQHVKTMDLPKVFPIVVPSLLCFLRFLSFHHRFTICSPGLLRSCSVFHDLAQFSTIFPACSTIFPFPPFSYHFPPSFALFLALTSPAGGPGLHRPRDDQRPSGTGHVGRGQRTGAEHRPGLHGVLQPSLGDHRRSHWIYEVYYCIIYIIEL